MSLKSCGTRGRTDQCLHFDSRFLPLGLFTILLAWWRRSVCTSDRMLPLLQSRCGVPNRHFRTGSAGEAPGVSLRRLPQTWFVLPKRLLCLLLRLTIEAAVNREGDEKKQRSEQ